jgi:hypothetical protein
VVSCFAVLLINALLFQIVLPMTHAATVFVLKDRPSVLLDLFQPVSKHQSVVQLLVTIAEDVQMVQLSAPSPIVKPLIHACLLKPIALLEPILVELVSAQVVKYIAKPVTLAGPH